MKSAPTHLYRSFLIGFLLLTGCAVPQHFWPQKDIAGSDMNTITGQHSVLIASRASEYKIQLVVELRHRLSAAKMPHLTIGVKQLGEVDPTDYAAVVIIAPCLAWGLDHEVSTFLESRKTTDNIILHITSGKGSWLPDQSEHNVDAISGASIKANVSDVARILMEKIKRRYSNKGRQS